MVADAEMDRSEKVRHLKENGFNHCFEDHPRKPNVEIFFIFVISRHIVLQTAVSKSLYIDVDGKTTEG